MSPGSTINETTKSVVKLLQYLKNVYGDNGDRASMEAARDKVQREIMQTVAGNYDSLRSK